MSIKQKILSTLDDGDGYLVSSLSTKDLEVLRALILEQYKSVMLRNHPELADTACDVGLQNYHELEISDQQHKAMWTKQNRTLFQEAISVFRNLDFFERLEYELGSLIITNEDQTRTEEIYWRLVRPNHSEDIGPMHADAWFWDLQNGAIDHGLRRLKIWIAVFTECGSNGLKIVPRSQHMKINFSGEKRDGKFKPVKNLELESRSDTMLVPTNPGNFILFHDNLLHGGAMGGSSTRVSLEFTALCRIE